MTYTVDQRAIQILLDAFWSSSGWKPEAMRGPSPDDFDYAKSKGVMFAPAKFDHERTVNNLVGEIRRLDRRCVADAFLSSLSTRRLDWRSALGSYAVFHQLRPHAAVNVGGRCGVCGAYLSQIEEDLNVLNFERYKWGGIRHDQPGYAVLDLKMFLGSETPRPSPEDVRIFRDLMKAIFAAPADTTSAGLQAHFAKVVRSNKAERDVIVAILGFCGILGTSEHPGYADSFVTASERRLPDRRFVDMSYPACWWRGTDGVNRLKLEEYFGHVL
jgi:hypothetical protein